MSKKDKRLQKIRNNPSDVSYHDLETVLIDQGFIITQGKGSHAVFAHPNLHGIEDAITLPKHGRVVKKPYVLKALKLIDKLNK